MTVITEQTPGYSTKIVPRFGATNTQLIISKIINGTNYIWNFNADVNNDCMGKIPKGMDALFNLQTLKWYKRSISVNSLSFKLNIIPMNNSEIDEYIAKIEAKNKQLELDGTRPISETPQY